MPSTNTPIDNTVMFTTITNAFKKQTQDTISNSLSIAQNEKMNKFLEHFQLMLASLKDLDQSIPSAQYKALVLTWIDQFNNYNDSLVSLADNGNAMQKAAAANLKLQAGIAMASIKNMLLDESNRPAKLISKL